MSNRQRIAISLILPSMALAAFTSAAKSVSVAVEAGDCRSLTAAEIASLAEGDTLVKTGGGELTIANELSVRLAAVDVQGGKVTLDDAFRREGLAAMWSFDDAEDFGYDIAPAHAFPLAVDAASTEPPTLIEDGVSGRALHFGHASKTSGAKLFRADAASPSGHTPSGNSAFTFSFWMRPTVGACGTGPNFIHIDRMSGGSLQWGNGFFFGSVNVDQETGVLVPSFKNLGFYCGAGWTRSGAWSKAVTSGGEKKSTNQVVVATFDDDEYLFDGKWHHVVGTYANRRMRIYVDGELRDERLRAADLNVTSDPYVQIGNWAATDGDHKYAGDLDELQYLAGEWTPEQVAAEYAAHRPLRDAAVRPSETFSGAAVTVGSDAVLSLAGNASWHFASVTGAGGVKVQGGSTLSADAFTDFAGTLVGAGACVFVADAAASATSPLMQLSSGTLHVPTVGKVVFTGFAEPIDPTRDFLLARAPGFAFPEDFRGWTFEPADDDRRLDFHVDGENLYVRLAKPEVAKMGISGRVAFGTVGSANPNYAETGWTRSYSGEGWTCPDGYTSLFTLAEKTATCISGVVQVAETDTRTVRATWRFTPTADIASLASLNVTLAIPNADFAGGKCVMGSAEKVLPAEYDGSTTFQWNVKNPGAVVLFDVGGNEHFTLTGISPNVTVLIQDNRKWNGDNFSVRLSAPVSSLTAGQTYEIAFDFTTPSGSRLVPGGNEIVSAGKDYARMKVPFGWIEPGSALDFSLMRGTDAPAGKYGRVVRNGAHFEFADRPGVPQRFYGVNIVQEAVVPDKDCVARYAANLARMGYNIARFHHHETYVCDAADDSKTTLDPVAMDKFDALVAALVTNGIYLTTDVYVSRKPTYRSIGIDRDGTVEMTDIKCLMMVDETVFENVAAFTRTFFGHVNPYTGRTLAQEPALVGVSLINEPCCYLKPQVYMQLPAWRAAWERWVAAKKVAEPEVYAAVTTDAPATYADQIQGPAFMRFLMETENAMAARMRTLLEDELHCQAPITSLNNSFVSSHFALVDDGSTGTSWTAFEALSRAETYDYTAANGYWDHPSFLDEPYKAPYKQTHRIPIQEAALGFIAHVRMRHVDKPFMITEFNNCGPMDYRCIGGLMVGAMAALQDWDALCRFQWNCSATHSKSPEKGVVGMFDVVGDPVKLAMERALVPLFLRRDLAPLAKTYAVPLDPADYAGLSPNLGLKTTSLKQLWAGWYAKIGFADVASLPMADRAAPDFASAIARDSQATVMADLGVSFDAAGKWPVAGDGHVQVDQQEGRLVVDSPRTMGGFAPAGNLTAGPLSVDLGGVQSAVWATSLDGKEVPNSRRILLTHLTDVQNTRATYADESRTILLNSGSQPLLMKTARAEVALALAGRKCHVYALALDGSRRFEVPAEQDENGVLRFTADITADPMEVTFLYEIVQQVRGSFVLRYR